MQGEHGAGLSDTCCSQHRPVKPRQCWSGFHFTTFTAKQVLFLIFLKICLEIVFINLKTGLVFKRETKENFVEYKTPWGFQGSNRAVTTRPNLDVVLRRKAFSSCSAWHRHALAQRRSLSIRCQQTQGPVGQGGAFGTAGDDPSSKHAKTPTAPLVPSHSWRVFSAGSGNAGGSRRQTLVLAECELAFHTPPHQTEL